MKRTLYQSLIRAIGQHGKDRQRQVTAIWRCPPCAPVWSPGADWVELDTASLWARRMDDGCTEVLVLTSTLDETGRYRDDEALIYAVLDHQDGIGVSSVSDKHHKVYTWAKPGTARPYVVFAQPDVPMHPAEIYWRYVEAVEAGFIEEAVNAAGARRYFDVFFYTRTARHPNGSFLLGFETDLSQHRTCPDPDTGRREFWWDAARFADVVATVSATYGTQVRVAPDTSCRDVNDPLWRAGAAVLWPRRRKT